jgi:RimJ/RimL family protein N-acetyltransferase
VARRAVETALGHGFGALGLVRVNLRHAVGNRASCAVAGSSGFAFEGVERSAMDHGDGVMHDVHRHARLAADGPGPVPVPRVLEPVEIGAGRLHLVPWQPTDADDVQRAFAEPDIVRWGMQLQPGDRAAAARWVAGRAAGWRDGVMASWSVRDATTGWLLGSVAVKDLDRNPGTGVASYWVRAEERGQGVAGQALAAATRFSHAVLGLHRVELYHAVANEASCRVAGSAGFALEGLLRGSRRLPDGITDEHLHARLAPDEP